MKPSPPDPSATQGSRPERAIDWQQVRARLAQAESAMRASFEIAPERARQVLEERARRLARVPPQAPQAAEIFEIVTFLLGSERYGLETRYVRSVMHPAEITWLPGAPESLLGVVALRGHIVPVFDLHGYFALSRAQDRDQERFIFCGEERLEFSFPADAVLEVVNLRIDQVLKPPDTIAGIARELLRGVTEDALTILDGGALLKDGRLFIDQTEDKGN